jgi:hypothetical protein
MNEFQDQVMNLTGRGIPYHLVYHLLEGSPRPVRPLPGQSKRFHDANLLWRDTIEDRDIEEINSLEMEIGELTSPILDVRTMVDFCCIWRYDYPENLLTTCEAIGGKVAYPSRCHYQIGVERGDELNAYASALNNWLKGEQSFTTEQEKEITGVVFRILGKRNGLKEKLVERTCLGLINRHIDCSFFGYDPTDTKVSVSPFHSQPQPSNWQRRIYELEREITEEMGGEGYNFLGEVGGVEPPCHFKYIRRLLILIGSIGVLKWRGYVPPLDPRMKGRRELTRLCLTALESFCRGEYLPSDARLDKQQKEIYKKIIERLGRPDTLKKWLAYSLYKNVKNQTLYQAYTMKRWVEFVRIKDSYLRNLSTSYGD